MIAKKILIVDDDMMSRQMAEFILKQGGYEIHQVKSGDGALSALGLSDYDLVLLDVEMPGMDGVQTLKEIRQLNGRMKDVDVIFLTADGTAQTVTNAAKLGAIGYIKKPFLPQELLDRVDKILIANMK